MDDTTDRRDLPAPPGADQPPAGTYVWDVVVDQWWWGDEIYAIHGFTPGEVVPSTDVLLAHQHLDDLDTVVRVLGHAREHGGRFSCYHRVVEAQAKVRHVLVVGGATTGDDGGVRELSGFMADLTRAQRCEVQPSVEQAVEGVLEHRGVIDLAKGVVMLGYGVDADQAFAVLRTSSAKQQRQGARPRQPTGVRDRPRRPRSPRPRPHRRPARAGHRPGLRVGPGHRPGRNTTLTAPSSFCWKSA